VTRPGRPLARLLSAGFAAAALLACLACSGKGLPGGSAKDVGMDPARLKRVSSIVREAIARKDFPGAVVLVQRKGKVVLREAYGDSQTVPERRPMTADMIFDLASLTKPIATATAVMILAERGELSLYEKVKSYIPEFAPFPEPDGKPGEDIRLWHLMTHTSGLPPYTDAAEAEKKFGSPVPVESLVIHIGGLPKTDPPGAKFTYSCLNYITLAAIVKKISRKSIAEFAAREIFEPLGMARTMYNPPPDLRSLVVPTQVYDGKPLVGIVHDPLARAQGGVSGNAGLFSTADDLAVFAQMMLNKGEYKGRRLLSPLTVERMTSIYSKAQGMGRGLGWDISSAYASVAGDIFAPGSYGHSGYTGTSIWIDPETQTSVIFLTNRVHPDDGGEIIAMRGRLANAVAASIVKR
jgi:CubicO group peptidase (beta-lactamase class C family)